MTTDTDRADFIRAICTDPSNDTLRLVYSDWLEEHGETEQSEFIRAQIELAKPCRLGFSDAYHVDMPCPACDPHYRREQELLANQSNPFGNRLTWTQHPQPTSEHCFAVEFRRGFVHTVRCSLEDWAGKVCNHCRGGGNQQDVNCKHCHGSGRVGGHGVTIVLAQPVEVLELTDVAITTVDHHWLNHARKLAGLPELR